MYNRRNNVCYLHSALLALELIAVRK